MTRSSTVSQLVRRVYGCTLSQLPVRLARRVHEDLALKGPPYSAWRIAEELGVSIVEDPYLPARGRLSNDENGKPSISLSGRYAALTGAANFTVGHELGHYVLRNELREFGFIVKPQADDDEERFAERFAAHLLMPLGALQPQLDAHPITPRRLIALSLNFQVSLPALITRMGEIGTNPVHCALFCRTEMSWCVAASTGHVSVGTSLRTGDSVIQKASDQLGMEIVGRGFLLTDSAHRSQWSFSALGLNTNSVLAIMSVARPSRKAALRETTANTPSCREAKQIQMAFRR